MPAYPSKSDESRLWHLTFSLLAAGILAYGSASAADYVMAIDVSGSMLLNKAGKRIQGGSNEISRIEIVRPALRNYVASLPDDSRIYLIAFNSGIVSEREFLLNRAGDREKAAAWVSALAPPRKSDTHLFATTRRALLKAREYAASSEEGWVNVRIITDGENEHPGSDLTLREVLGGFPEIPKGLMLPDLILLGSLKAEFIAPLEDEERRGTVNLVRDETFSEAPFPPVIKWAPDPAVAGQEVTFFDASKSAFQSHSWSINEEAAGEGKTIKHTFTEPGRYVVRLSVERKSGSRDRAQMVVNVGTSPIKADFHVPSEIVAGRQADFVNRSTGEVEASSWTVDDKPAGSERDLAFTFESEGTHAVVLEITGKNDQKDVATRSVTVQPPPPPPASPKAGIRTVGEVFKAGEPVQFMDQSSGLVESHSWDFAGEGASSDKNPVHSFKAAGQRTVTLTVKGPGGEDQASVQVGVLPPGPTIVVTAEPEKGTIPFDVQFSATIDGNYESIEWDFGDGETSADVSPKHSFTAAGDYSVTATLTFKGIEGPGTVTSNSVEIRAKAPFPLWGKVLIGIAGALLVWTLVIVPLLRGGLACGPRAHGRATLRSNKTYEIFALARRHKTNLFWPRRHVTIGHSRSDDIRLSGSGRAAVARIRRVPFQPAYQIVPSTKDSVVRVEKRTRPDGTEHLDKQPVTKPATLKDGAQIEVSGTTFTFQWGTTRKKAAS